MADEIDQAITDAATAPKSITVDGTQTVERDVSELIEFDKYRKGVAAVDAGANPWGLLRPARVVPPGGS